MSSKAPYQQDLLGNEVQNLPPRAKEPPEFIFRARNSYRPEKKLWEY